MLIGFIARGMRSKRIARLEQQLSDNIKVTHQKIWSGVTKDVGYLRRILNEIYLMKFRVRFLIFQKRKKKNEKLNCFKFYFTASVQHTW